MMKPEYIYTTSPSLLLRVRDPADDGAWRTFDARYGNLIVNYCRHRGLQQADAEDVRQQVWVNLAKGLHDFEYDPSRGRFRNYLGRVVRAAIFRQISRNSAPDQALTTGVRASVAIENDDDDESWQKE